MSEPLTPARLAEIRGRLEAATPGPWTSHYDPNGEDGHFIALSERAQPGSPGWPAHHRWVCAHDVEPVDEEGWVPQFHQVDADANLIANAPADIAALLKDHARQAAEISRLQAALDEREGLCAECYWPEMEEAGLSENEGHPKFYLNTCSSCGQNQGE